MMKSFFKKLAFVMALAMVVTLAAPAAKSAMAATTLRLAEQDSNNVVTSLTMKVDQVVDLCFLGAGPGWQKLPQGWTVTPADGSVITVDKRGNVTAVAVGKGEVTFKMEGYEPATIPVVVTADTVVSDKKVTLGYHDGSDKALTTLEMKVGDTPVDLDFFGVSDWATESKNYKCTWTSSNSEVATVNNKNGVVTPVAAGTATISLSIVNQVTGFAWTVIPVTVTVTAAEAEVSTEFTVKQVSTDVAELLFEDKETAAKVTVDNLDFAILIGDTFVNMPVKSVAAADGTVTVELFSKLVDKQVYCFVFDGVEKKFVASVGEIANVAFSYWTDEAGDGKAYVDTEEDAMVTMEYILYDAQGVNITDLYEESDLSIEYNAPASEAYDLDENTITFTAATAALVTLTVTWTNDDGEDQSKEFTGVVMAAKRPALAFTVVDAGMISLGGWQTPDANAAYDDFKTNAKSYFWTNQWATTTWVKGDGEGEGLHFAALVKDNRGNTVATGKEDYKYGTFLYETSNDNVIDINSEGEITIVDAGTASILIYFLKADYEDETKDKVFVGSCKLTVKPSRYPASYKVDTSATVASSGASNSGSFKLYVYDQYGGLIQLENGAADITVKAVSGTNNVALSATWNGSDNRYEIGYNSGDFATALGTSFKYTVSIDKEENPRLSGNGSATLTLKVTNVNAYNESLTTFLNGGTAPKSFYFKTSGGGSVDLYVDNVANYLYTWRSGTVKTKSISLNYLNSANGFTMAKVPAANIHNITGMTAKQLADLETKVGHIYYTVSAPKNAKNYAVSVDNGKITLSFNDAPVFRKTRTVTTTTSGSAIVYGGYYLEDGKVYQIKTGDSKGDWTKVTDGVYDYTRVLSESDIEEVKLAADTTAAVSGSALSFTKDGDKKASTYNRDQVVCGGLGFEYATTGTYKVTLYYVTKDGGSLKVLDTYSYTVTNSQPEFTFAGFDSELGNKTSTSTALNTSTTKAEVEAVIRENMVFSYNGTTYSQEKGNNNYNIVDVKYELSEGKVRIDKIWFEVEVDDGEFRTAYTYTSELSVKKYIYEE